MNRILVVVLSFSLTFVLGSLLVPTANYYVVPEAKSVHLAQPPTAEAGEVGEKMTGIEFSDLAEMDDFAHLEPLGKLIDISETQGIYRESDVVAISGEKWLTLRERNGSYSLISATANVKKKPTVSYSGEEHDVELSFFNGGAPIFAVRKLPAVQPGLVTTVYHRPSRKEIERRNLPIYPMKTGFKREFYLNDVGYTLRVSRGQTRDGTIVGILVLESDGVAQVIARNYYEPPYGETIGELLWVGDLDRDGKLDLYFDEFNEKGYFGVGLYLSSSADPGKLVKLAATFSTSGC